MTDTRGDGVATPEQGPEDGEPTAGRADILDMPTFDMPTYDMAKAHERAIAGFVAGTMIATSDGERRVEMLAAGDRIATATGAVVVLRGVRQRRVDGTASPIRVAAHAFGTGRPARDLRVGPGTRLRLEFLGDLLIPVATLVNSATIAPEAVESALFFELDLETAAAVLADGLEVQVGEDQARPATYDHGPVVEATLLRLGARLAGLGWTLQQNMFAGLHLLVDGAHVAMRTSGLAASAMIPVAARHVWLVSARRDAETVLGTVDDRLLGVPLAALSIDDGLAPRRVIALDDPRLCIGFHEPEGDRRWTTGRARVPASLWEGCEGHVFVRVDLGGPALPRWAPPEAPFRLDMTRDEHEPSIRGEAPAGARILYWYETTGRQPYETGIQRVTRWLARALAASGAEVSPAMFDPRRRDIAVATRSRAGAPLEDAAAWLLVVEVPSCLIGLGLDPLQLARAYGLRTAALVHDLIPMKLVEHYDDGTRALFARYYAMFAQADLVFATTAYVAADLRAHLAARGLRVPEIRIVPLAAQFADVPRRTAPVPPRRASEPLRLLTVGTLEPRKNVPGLLRAVRLAAARGVQIDLTIAGKRLVHQAYEAEVDALVAQTPGATFVEMPDDAALAALYADCHAGIYGFCEEGFGLPVVESLWLGRPCICHDRSAMAEVAPGGGTLMIDMADEAAIADTLVELAARPEIVERLAAEAAARPLRTWADVAGEVIGHLGSGTAP